MKKKEPEKTFPLGFEACATTVNHCWQTVYADIDWKDDNGIFEKRHRTHEECQHCGATRKRVWSVPVPRAT